MAFGNPHARVSCWETHLQMAFSAWGGHRRVESWEDWGAAAVEIREQLTHLTNQMSFKHIVSAVWDPLPLYRKKSRFAASDKPGEPEDGEKCVLID